MVAASRALYLRPGCLAGFHRRAPPHSDFPVDRCTRPIESLHGAEKQVSSAFELCARSSIADSIVSVTANASYRASQRQGLAPVLLPEIEERFRNLLDKNLQEIGL